MIEDLLTNHAWFIYSLIALFSLACGSLLNVVIYRLPIMLQSEWKQECSQLLNMNATTSTSASINLFFPRSFCPHCKTTIRSWENIPLLSYFVLQGRCNECNNPISKRYPLIETLTLVLSLFACWHFGLTSALPYVLLAICLIICMIIIDLDHHILPDSLTLSLLWLGLVANTQGIFTSLPDAVLSAAGAYVFLWLLMQVFYLITGKVGMGHGDFKLFAAFAAWLGWTELPLLLLLSSISGCISGLLYLKISKKTKDTPIPFGPFLCVSGLICIFWGHEIINSYLALIY